MICAELDIDRTLAAHESLQLQDALARHDDLLLIKLGAIQLRLAKRQPVAIRCYRTQMLPACFQQHAVQVIPHILLRHGEMRLVNQARQRTLVDSYRLAGFDVLDGGKLGRRQRSQRELASSGPHRGFFARDADVYIRTLWQRPADIQEFAA